MGEDKNKKQPADPFRNASAVVIGKARGINEQLDRLLEKRKMQVQVQKTVPKPSPA